MSELAKEKLYRKELIKAGATGDNNVERIRSLEPEGTLEITTTNEVDVSKYAKAQVVDEDLIATNIRLGKTILGVEGNLEPDKPDQTKNCTPTTSEQVIQADTGYELASVTVEAVTSAIDANITAGNIKKDVEILGVTGTYEGSGGAGATYNIETLQATLPQNYKDYSCIQVGGNVYIFGGSLNNTTIDTIYKFNIDTETLSTLQTTLPTADRYLTLFSVGSNVYMYGGEELGQQGGMYKFDVDTETLTTLQATMQDIIDFDFGLVNGKNYFWCFDENEEAYIGKFDTNTETFSTVVTTIPPTLEVVDSFAVCNSDIYLFYETTIYKFNVDTETITTLQTTLPMAISEADKIINSGNNIYIFSYSNVAIYKFNVDTETITTLQATLPQNYNNYRNVAQVGSNIYLLGGSTNMVRLDTIYKFNIDTEIFTILQETLPMAIYDAYTAQVGSNIYLLGGNNNNGFLNTIVKVNVSF